MRVWNPPLEAFLDHNPKKETLRIETPRSALIRLGETEARGYRLQIGLKQTRWTGGIGVYFGGRPGPAPALFHFQLVHLIESEPLRGPPLNLVRSTGTVEPKGRGMGLMVPTDQFATTPNLCPVVSQEHLLELEIRPGGLASVLWNGHPCPELVDAGASAEAVKRGVDFRGEFGIYCHGNSVFISKARIMQTE
jgi:hypothetical protein